jgi:hypothetical protein
VLCVVVFHVFVLGEVTVNENDKRTKVKWNTKSLSRATEHLRFKDDDTLGQYHLDTLAWE